MITGPSMSNSAKTAAKEPETDCRRETEQYTSCASAARVSMVAKLAKVDERPDLIERKTCNMLENLENCEKKMSGPCKEKHSGKIHDNMVTMIKQLQESLPKWDSKKCPAALHYLNGAGSLQLGLAVLLAAIFSLILTN